MQTFGQTLSHTTCTVMKESCTSACNQIVSEFKNACVARSKDGHCNASCVVKVFINVSGVKESMGTSTEGRGMFGAKLRDEFETLGLTDIDLKANCSKGAYRVYQTACQTKWFQVTVAGSWPLEPLPLISTDEPSKEAECIDDAECTDDVVAQPQPATSSADKIAEDKSDTDTAESDTDAAESDTDVESTASSCWVGVD